MPCNCNNADPLCEPCAICTPPGVTGLTTCEPVDICDGHTADIHCIIYSGIPFPELGVETGDTIISVLQRIFTYFYCDECFTTTTTTTTSTTTTTTTSTTTTSTTTTTTTEAPECGIYEVTGVDDETSIVGYMPCNCDTAISVPVGVGETITICADVAYGILSGSLIDVNYLGVCDTPAPPECISTSTTTTTTLEPTTTTTSTTTTSTSTTTTTIPICECYVVAVPGGPGSPSRAWSYYDCDGIFTEEFSEAGEIRYVCAQLDSIIAPGCIVIAQGLCSDEEVVCNTTTTLGPCTCYTITNLEEESGVDPYILEYVDCDSTPVEIELLEGNSISVCALVGSISTNFEYLSVDLGACGDDCPPTTTTTTSTTTTTTTIPCMCYTVENDQEENIAVDLYDCNGEFQHYEIVPDEIFQGCALLGLIFSEGTIVEVGNCDENCTTTTTTSTTSTTTTTTTEAPELGYVYFSNSPTSGDRGARIFLSPNNYYGGAGDASDLIPSNCWEEADLGLTPAITVNLNYWTDDVFSTIDDGFGNVRTPDGTKTITISSDGLTYNVTDGCWDISTGIFTLYEGTNIAAFEITFVTNPYFFVVNHIIFVPPANNFIRVHNTFSAGTTSVTWFDLP